MVELACGRYRTFTHVFAVGIKASRNPANRISGAFANPRTDSSSVPQTNRKYDQG